jgi:hypothetical protein
MSIIRNAAASMAQSMTAPWQKSGSGGGSDKWVVQDGTRKGDWSDSSSGARLWDSQYARGSDGGLAFCSTVAAGASLDALAHAAE